MPKALGFQRKHRKIGYLIKYFYYCVKKRSILEKRVSFGKANPERTIYLIKPDYLDGVEGLLSLIYRQVIYIQYAKEKNYIPYVDWKKYNTQYYNGIDNVWEYFFMQSSSLNYDEVYNSKKVILSGWTLKDKNPHGYFSSNVFFNDAFRKKCSRLLVNNIVFSDQVNELVSQELLHLDINNCVGVYIRGTDYVKLKPSGEYVQPSVSDVIPVVHDFLKKYGLQQIYLVTEDGDIFDKMSEEFGSMIKIVSFDSFVRGLSDLVRSLRKSRRTCRMTGFL